MHTIFGGMIKLDYESMLSRSENVCSLTKQQKSTLELRIEKAKEFINTSRNNKLKRNLNQFQKVSGGWKTNQFADFFFYASPIVFLDLVDVRVYGIHLMLNYLVDRLWNGGVKIEELEQLDLIAHNYLKHHQILYPSMDQTSNLHATEHFVETFEELGPFKDYNGFIFEAINGEIKSMISGSTALIDQIASRSEANFMARVKEKEIENEESNEWKVLGNPIFDLGLETYKGVKKSNMDIKGNQSYVMLNDGRFVVVAKIFKENQSIKCSGFELKNCGNLKFRMTNKVFPIEHILFGEVIYRSFEFELDSIEEVIFFIPKFGKDSSSFVDHLKGFIIRTIYSFHN